MINQLIKEAKLKDAQKPKDYDSIINDDFIKQYNEIMSKRLSNGINLFVSENINKNSLDHKTELSRVTKLWSSLKNKEKKVNN